MRAQNPYLDDRNQGHSRIAHYFVTVMQRGQVSHRAGEERVAVLFQREGEALEPVGPPGAWVASRPDQVDGGLVHVHLEPAVAGHNGLRCLLNMQKIYRGLVVPYRHLGVG